MNKFYLIVPTTLLAVFCFYYVQFSQEIDRKEREKVAATAKLKADDDRKKQEAIDRAAIDAKKRDAETQAKAAKEEADRRAKWDAESREIADKTAEYQQEADTDAKQVEDLTQKLDALHKARAEAENDLFNLQKDNELTKIAKRQAELEIQRTYAMVTQKVADSSLTFAPPTPAAPAAQ